MLSSHAAHQDSTYEMLDPSEFFIRPVDFVNLRQAEMSNTAWHESVEAHLKVAVVLVVVTV